ncbi:MAG: cobalt-precorrin-5B (C(1))-methyltransferase CbiD [Planctomycetota bacterium]|jgi:cobalt-precorrin-5B (C1)-methyltransferase|nr:cobalt-precorrin-5B (C(1))-methyltransferase CbiD [Planctomycetota bacterium]
MKRLVLPPGCGPTTGSCAAAAALAALTAWRGGEPVDAVEVALPDGRSVAVEIASADRIPGGARATVVKPENGDDDLTAGVAITVSLSPLPEPGLVFVAGAGVGAVTRPGLSVPPGEPAINPTPRRMIAEALAGAEHGWRVEIAAAGGREIAKKTYNPRLGVVGGISIIGTTGIVRPFCRAAFRDSLLCSFSVAKASGHDAIILAPGHIGARAAERRFSFRPEQLVEVGNAWDDAFELVRGFAFDCALVAGHPGKLAKLARGPVDTHSAGSGSALPILEETLAAMGTRTPGDAGTAEALFSMLEPEAAGRLAERVAERIASALTETVATGRVAVWLCDLAGGELGSAGDLTPWQ